MSKFLQLCENYDPNKPPTKTDDLVSFLMSKGVASYVRGDSNLIRIKDENGKVFTVTVVSDEEENEVLNKDKSSMQAMQQLDNELHSNALRGDKESQNAVKQQDSLRHGIASQAIKDTQKLAKYLADKQRQTI